MEKRYNFRIYPNARQEALIQRSFGCCRFVYNHYLAKRKEVYETERRLLSLNECEKDLALLKKEEGFEWLAEADANALLGALKDLDRAYRAFFRRVRKGGVPGFPRFRDKRGRQSYRSRKNICRRNIEIEKNRVKLTKLGWVRCRTSRPVEGRILSATVLQSGGGKYFVSVCCTDVIPRPLPKTGRATRLRLGIEPLATVASGGAPETFENPRYFERSEKKIARLSRRLSRKSKDGKNREKARIRLARAHESIANRRADFLNKLSTRLAREYDAISVVPGIEVPANVGGGRLAKLASDAGHGTLIRMLRYKCDRYGRAFGFADAAPPDIANIVETEEEKRGTAGRAGTGEGISLWETEAKRLPERPRRARKENTPRRSVKREPARPAAAGTSNTVL